MALCSLSIRLLLLIGTIGNRDWLNWPPVSNPHPLEEDALRIGECLSGDTWLKCSGGKNDMKIGPGDPKCLIGEPAAIEIYCT